jgi:hypothetical protein
LCRRSWFPPFAKYAKNGAPLVGDSKEIKAGPPGLPIIYVEKDSAS